MVFTKKNACIYSISCIVYQNEKEVNQMNPFILNDKKCPICNKEIDEWTFIGQSLDDSVINKESGGLSFEVEAECPHCGEKIIGLLWLVDIYAESKIDKMAKGL